MDNNYGGSYFEGRKPWKMAEGENGGTVASDFLTVDDLLDFSNEEIAGPIVGAKNGADSSTVTDSLMSMSCTREDMPLHDIGDSYGEFDANDYTGDLCVPCDDVAELEWLSNFVEDSFSTGSVVSNGEMNMNECAKKQCHEKDLHPVPGKARSKRSRAPVCNWVSYILSPSSSTTTKPCEITNGGTTSEVTYLQGYEATTTTMKLSKGTATQGGSKKKLGGASSHHHHHSQHQEQTRRCTHCGTQKTPQWRAGPQGPKTLCNACGVRYKSGRLLPEYRPAASPTFVMSQHSNSHRKVLEMRRQREAEDHQHHFQEIVQGLMQSDQSSYIEDECLLHTNHNTREDSFCRV